MTIGSMLPFDRLVEAMDAWAAANPDTEVFAQIGRGSYIPRHMAHEPMLAPARYAELVARARLIVSHAGVGTVVAATDAGKPLVMMPRRAAFREHTTDHQLATARWLEGRPGIFVADTEAELGPRIDAALAAEIAPGQMRAAPSEELVARLREVIFAAPARKPSRAPGAD